MLFRWFVGIDWAAEKYDVCVLDAGGKVIAKRVIKHSGSAIAELLDWLQEGATMLAEASQPLAERDYHALRCYAGCAPVTRQSGKRKLVLMRRGCSERLRNALYYWSLGSLKEDWARQYYDRQRASGNTHGGALR